jgi:hypothetical protein
MIRPRGDFSKPPPRGSFDYLLDGIRDEARPPPRDEPPRRQRINLTIWLPPPPRPKPPVGFRPTLFWLLVLGTLILLAA